MGRIKFLELQNFRSYKGRHVIGPLSRLSAIIGPNGGGKSNILDALAFVLGVRSTQLRSTNLSDLRYKPPKGKDQGAREAEPETGCHVKMVFSDEDYPGDGNEPIDVDISTKDIVFQRSIPKAGTSTEYRINGKVVSKEEYTKQLSEKNVLVRARNFIVFQGDMASLGRRTEKELTQMIEVISGSGELKKEYDELRMKKDSADELKLYSIMKRRGVAAEKKQFKEQKEEALRFKDLLERKEQLYREQFLFDLYHLNQSKVGFQRKGSSLKAELGEISESLDVLNSASVDKRKEKAKKHKQTLVLNRKIQHLKNELDKTKPTQVKLMEHKSNMELSLGNKEKLKIKLGKEKEKQEQSMKEIEEEIAASEQILREMDERYEELQDNELSKSGEAMKEYTRLKSQVNSETIELRETMLRHSAARREAAASLEEVEGKTKELRLQDEQFATNHANLVDRRAGIEQGLEQLTESEEILRKEMTEYKEKSRTLHEQRKQVSESLDSALAKLRQVKSDKVQALRYIKSQEVVSGLKRLFPKVIGRLMDLCVPVHKKYDMALGVALGKFSEAIVVKDRFTAMECISYLRDQKQGVYTFLPLDALKTKHFDVDELRTVRDATLVADLVKHDAQIKHAVNFVLQDTLLADDLEAARSVAFGGRKRHKVVTMDGCVVRKSGLITIGKGGISQQGSSKWDDQRIDALRKKKEESMRKYSKIAEEIRRLPLESEIHEKIVKIETNLKFSRMDLQLIDDRIKKISGEMKRIKKDLGQNAKKEKEILQKVRASAAEEEAMESKIAKVEAKLFKGFCKSNGIESVAVYEETVINVNTDALSERRKLLQKVERLKNEIQYEKRSNFASKIDALDKEMEKDIERIVEIQGDGDALEKKLKEIQNKLNAAHAKYLSMVSDEDGADKELKHANEEIRNVSSTFNDLNKELSVCEVSMDQIKSKCGNILRQCKVEGIPLPYLDRRERSTSESGPDSPQSLSKSYGTSELTFDSENRTSTLDRDDEISLDYSYLPRKLRAPLPEEDVEAQRGKYEKEFNAILAELAKMDPNLKSIEKLDDVKGRLRLINEDLDKILKDALQVETEFEAVARERTKRFKKAFNTVSLHIGRIYEDMTTDENSFNKGHAHLSLENPQEPYLGMVFYHPNPPQKQNAGLETLSDGEKAVAILSLLFAFHKVKQAPFFLLDEIDESLDATNVKRVARFFKGQSQLDTQIVCISHKADFFSQADVLIGVVKDRAEDSSKVFTFSLAGHKKEALEMAETLSEGFGGGLDTGDEGVATFDEVSEMN